MKTIKTLLAATALLLAGLTQTAHAYVGACVYRVQVTINHFNSDCPFFVATGGAGTNTWSMSTNTFSGGWTETWTSDNNFAVSSECWSTNAATLNLNRPGPMGSCCNAIDNVFVDVWTCDGHHVSTVITLSYGIALYTVQLVLDSNGVLSVCPIYSAPDPSCFTSGGGGGNN